MEMKETYHVISNTHWDREWYQTHENYLARLVPLMDRLVSVMERQPNYRFLLDGQYIMVRDYLAAKPEKTETVKALISAGRLLCGPWYTQPLENLVSGEGLVRNLQYGIRYSEALGRAERFSYEIDEFGHTSQLPQILQGFDIPSVMAWRGMPKGTKSVFVWRAPDGSAVHMFYSKSGYGEATALPAAEDDFTETIDGVTLQRAGLRSRVERLRRLRKANSDSTQMLWLNGIDHSWAQPDILSVIGEINRLYPDVTVRQSTPDEYAAAVLADYEERGIPMQEITGELLYIAEDVLESTNSLHPVQKQTHYAAETGLIRHTEPFTAAAWMLGMEYPAWALDRAWEYVLENHAHDSLGCCSVDGVYEQVMARYHASQALAGQITENALRHLMYCGTKEPALYLFNASSDAYAGCGIFRFAIPAGFGSERFALENEDGTAVPMTILDAEKTSDVRYNPLYGHPTWGEKTEITAWLRVPEVPAAGYRRFLIKADTAHHGKRNRPLSYFSPRPLVMENEFLTVTINPDGTFIMRDKRNNAEYLEQMRFEDTGDAGHCYIHEPAEYDGRTVYSSSAEITMLYDTPEGCAYRVKTFLTVPRGVEADRKHRTAEEAVITVTADIVLPADGKQLDIKLKINNTAENHRLRVLFPTVPVKSENENRILPTESFSGQPFDCVFRPIHAEFEPDVDEQPYPTHPMQDYCGVCGENWGLAVAAEGIYEYECTEDGTLALTVLRANDAIDCAAFLHDPAYRLNAAEVQGTVIQHLSLIPYDGKQESLLPLVSRAVNPPTAVVNRQPEDSVLTDYHVPERVLGAVGTLFAMEGEGLRLTAVRHALAGDALIVRFWNPTDRDITGGIRMTLPGTKPYVCQPVTLEEKPAGAALAVDESGTAVFTVRAHGLYTVMIK